MPVSLGEWRVRIGTFRCRRWKEYDFIYFLRKLDNLIKRNKKAESPKENNTPKCNTSSPNGSSNVAKSSGGASAYKVDLKGPSCDINNIRGDVNSPSKKDTSDSEAFCAENSGSSTAKETNPVPDSTDVNNLATQPCEEDELDNRYITVHPISISKKMSPEYPAQKVQKCHGSQTYPVLGSGTTSGEADAIKDIDCPDMTNTLLLRSGDVELNPGPNETPGNLSELDLYLLADDMDPSDRRKVGLALGFTEAQLGRFEKDQLGNSMHATYQMLCEWGKTVRESKARETLVDTLESIKLVELAGSVRTGQVGDHIPSMTEEEIQRVAEEVKCYYIIHLCQIQADPLNSELLLHFDRLFTNLTLMEEDKDTKRKTPLLYDDLLNTKVNGNYPKRLLVEGEGGVGKTTFCAKIAWDWIHGKGYQDFKLVLFILLRDAKEKTVGEIVKSYLSDNNPTTAKQLDKHILSNSDEVFLVLDGLDESTIDLNSNQQIALITSNRLLNSGTVLITSRRRRSDEIRKNANLRKGFAFVAVEGFSAENLSSYITKFFHPDTASSEDLNLFVSNSDVIRENMAPYPVYAAMLCIMWKEFDGERREAMSKLQTFSQLFHEMVHFLIDHYLSKHIPSLGELRDRTDIRHHLLQIGRIAFQGLLERRLVFTEEEFQSCPESIHVGCKIGVLSREKKVLPRRDRTHNQHSAIQMVQFPHKLFQEYLSGMYLASLYNSNRNDYDGLMAKIIKEAREYRYLLYFTSAQQKEIGLDIVSRLTAWERQISNYRSSNDDFIIDVAYESQDQTVAKAVADHLSTTSRKTLKITKEMQAHTVSGHSFIMNHREVDDLIIEKPCGRTASEDLAEFICSSRSLRTVTIDLTQVTGTMHDVFYSVLAIKAVYSKIEKLFIDGCNLKENDPTASRDLARFLCLLPCLTDLTMRESDHLWLQDDFYHELALLASSSKNHFFNKKLSFGERSEELRRMDIKEQRQYIVHLLHPILAETTPSPTEPADINIQEAIRKGEATWNRSRIMVIGPAGVGKTSLIRRLTRQDFNPDEKSTKGAEQNVVTQSAVSRWVILNDAKTAKGDLIQSIATMDPKNKSSSTGGEKHRDPTATETRGVEHKHDQETTQETPSTSSQQQMNKENVVSTQKHIQARVKIADEVLTESKRIEDIETGSSRSSIGNENMSEATQKESSVQVSPTSDNDPIAEMSKRITPEEITKVKSSALDITYSIWDFGGQEIYYITHPLFLSWRSLYILVIPLHLDLSAPAPGKENALKQLKESAVVSHRTILDLIHFWLMSVYTHAVQDSNHEPKVLLIGTFAGDEGPGIIEKKVAAKFQELKDRLGSNPYWKQVLSPMCGIDNQSSPRSEVEKIQKRIDGLVKDSAYMKVLMPIKWRTYLTAIEDSDQNTLTVKEAEKTMKAFEINSDKVKAVLKFYHDIGHLIYHQGCELVVLKPQFLNNIVSNIITVIDDEKMKGDQGEYWTDLMGRGILSEELIKIVWEEQKGGPDQLDDIIDMMMEFDLICEIPTKRPSGRQFFVPCRSSSNLDVREIRPGEKDKRVEFTIDFHNFLPDGFLHRFFVRMAKWSMERMEFIKPTFHYRQMVFCIDDDHRMVMTNEIRSKEGDEIHSKEAHEIKVMIYAIAPYGAPPQPEPATVNLNEDIIDGLHKILVDLQDRWAKRIKYRVGIWCPRCADQEEGYKEWFHLSLRGILKAQKETGTCAKSCSIALGHILKAFNKDTSASSAANEVSTSKTRPTVESMDQNFDDLLKTVAEQIHKDIDIDNLGAKLGIKSWDIERYLQKNKQDHSYMGTLCMLRDWRGRTTESEKREQLKKALIAIGHQRLADLLKDDLANDTRGDSQSKSQGSEEEGLLAGQPRKSKKKTNRKTDSTDEDDTRGDNQSMSQGFEDDGQLGPPKETPKKTTCKTPCRCCALC